MLKLPVAVNSSLTENFDKSIVSSRHFNIDIATAFWLAGQGKFRLFWYDYSSYVYVFSVFLTLQASAFSLANTIFGFGKIQDGGSKMT